MRPLALRVALLVVVSLLAWAVAGRTQSVTGGPLHSFEMRVVATGLDGPWEVAWGPDARLWVTERRGRRVVRIDPADGSRTTALTLPDAHQSVGQDGLLGLALHPGLLRGAGTDDVYLVFTYDDAPGPELRRRVAIRRYEFNQASGTLVGGLDVLTGLPAHDDHIGGRLVIGPDLKLYLSLGDQGSNFGQNRCNANLAQALPTSAQIQGRDYSRYAGKILRIELDGSVPEDNPVLDGVRSHVFSYGHRNPLGLVIGPGGRLYESEHGPSSDDEVNLIEGGGNYGWPDVAGYRDDKAYVYSNWSASAPTPCSALPPGALAPASVPSRPESAFASPRFRPPLRTFFTVDSLEAARGLGGATIAPGGIDLYTGEAIAGWRDSLLALSLVRGLVYRLPLSQDGRSVGEPEELFASANRYRDIAIHPDGRTIFLATDAEGPSRGASGAPRPLANPGSILAYTLDTTFTPGGR